MDDSGYLVFAVNTEQRRQATALAYSLLARTPDIPVSLCVPDVDALETEYEEPFDQVIEFPYDKSEVARLNEWQAIYMTPYTHNIVLDCASIALGDMTNIWRYCTDNHDLCFVSAIKTFRDHTVKTDSRQKNYEHNKIDPVYSNMYYFRKDSQIALDYFKLCDPYFREYPDLYDSVLAKHHIPETFDANLSASISVTHLGIQNEVTPLHPDLFTFTDMVACKQGFSRDSAWTEYLNTWPSTDGRIKIQNYNVNNLLYYQETDFLTNDIFNEQQNYYRQQTQ